MDNFRDLGYGAIKKNMLFRGGDVGTLTKEDESFLMEVCHIKTILDLRTVEEVGAKKDKDLPGVKNINTPLLLMPDMGETVQGQFPDVLFCYRCAVSKEKREVWTRIFDVFLTEESAIMFHCTQGKDRTGIVAAILLSALGVNRETIFKDYLLTNEFAKFPEEYRPYAASMPEDIRKLFSGLFQVDEDFLSEMFLEIDRVYGSLINFLVEACGLTEEKLDRLKAKYLAK